MDTVDQYLVYAQDFDGKRRFLGHASANNGGRGLFALYADKCDDEEEVIITNAPNNPKIKWTIWSGEGERGTKKIKTATITGVKRILTRERCGGDRWAYACPSHWPDADCAAQTRECDIDNIDILNSYGAQEVQ